MKTSLSKAGTALVLLVFAVCLAGALTVPPERCPDETARMRLTGWIYEYGSLPTGNETETLIPGWGFSYALRPYLSAIIGAFFMKVFSLFSRSESLLLLGSRMSSVLSVTVCCIYCLLLGQRLFRKRNSPVLIAAVVCFLPQVLFIGFFQNNDSLSLAAVSMMLYYLARGYDDHFSVKTCLKLGIAFSVGFLSYYSVYGWILAGIVFCVVSVCMDPAVPRKGSLILQRGLLIAGVCLVLAGWFFIRNAILHEGDFFGIATELRMREAMRNEGAVLYEMNSAREGGVSVLRFLRENGFPWLKTTAVSFVGVFGYLDAVMPAACYIAYLAFFLAGFILFVASCRREKPDRRETLLAAVLLAAALITLLLSFLQSYTRNYQPQGRYVITAVLPLAFMIARGADRAVLPGRSGKSFSPAAVLTVLWLLMGAGALLILLPQVI